MGDTAETPATVNAAAATGGKGTQHKSGKGKRRTATALLVVAAVLAPLAMASVWVKNIVLDTDQYVDTVSPLASDPAIQDAAVDRITNSIMAAIDVQAELENLLPSQLSFLAAPSTAAVTSFVHDAVEKVITSETFQEVWDKANVVVHDQVNRLLTETETVELPDGRVVIDLTPVIESVITALSDKGLTFMENIDASKVAARLDLFDAPQLHKAQSLVSVMETLAYVLVVLTLACLVGAVVLSEDKRRAVSRIGIVLAASMGVFMVILATGRTVVLGALPDTVNSAAAESTWDILTNYLRAAVRAMFGLGLVLVLGAWLAGPSPTAVRVRGAVTRKPSSDEPGAVSRFVGAHANGLRVAVITVAGLLAMTVEHPRLRTIVIAGLVVVAGFVIISLVGARPDRSEPEPG